MPRKNLAVESNCWNNFIHTNTAQIVMFDSVPLCPPNPIFGVAQQCKQDTSPSKIDVTIGAYRDDDGKNVVLQCVRKAEAIIEQQQLDHGYNSTILYMGMTNYDVQNISLWRDTRTFYGSRSDLCLAIILLCLAREE